MTEIVSFIQFKCVYWVHASTHWFCAQEETVVMKTVFDQELYVVILT